MRILITGGAGFAGSALVRHLMEQTDHALLNFDSLTYAASQDALASVADNPRYRFVRGDVRDAQAIRTTLADFRPHRICHLAAETHVDRSIDQPGTFIATNVAGTATLLTEATRYWQAADAADRALFRFHHLSTDEVFGPLSEGAAAEDARYNPSSPYAASKAGADHLVNAWARTYCLPVSISHSCNLYGPWQFPEKLIPKTIERALAGLQLPLYGDGQQSREWLYVEDHARALGALIEQVPPVRRYNIGSGIHRRNEVVVEAICALLDKARPRPDGQSYRCQIVRAEDRPGHDERYALNSSRIRADLGWMPRTGFAEGLERTVQWHLSREG